VAGNRTQRIGAVLALALACGTGIIAASPASAVGCVPVGHNYLANYAVTDGQGTCSVVFVGHYFRPSGTSITFYTGEFQDPDWVRTPVRAIMVSTYHYGY